MTSPRRSNRLRTAVEPTYRSPSDDELPPEEAPSLAAGNDESFSADEELKLSTRKEAGKAGKPDRPRKK